MPYILDGIVVLVLVLCAINGFRRGFLKHIVLLLVMVLSAGGAMVCMNMFTDSIYNDFVKDTIEKAGAGLVQSVNINDCVKKSAEYAGISEKNITEKDINFLLGKGELSDNFEQLALQKGMNTRQASTARENFSDKLNEKLCSIFGRETANKIYSKLSGTVNISNSQLSKAVNLINKDKNKAAKYISDDIFAPVAKSVLKVIVFIASFIAIYIVIRLILAVFGVLKKFNSASMVNHLGGALLGVVKGGIYVTIAAFLLCLLVNSTNDGIQGLDVKTFESTRLFRYFFEFFYK